MICPQCHKEYEPVLKRKTNLKIQDEFPNESAWKREQLISGICCDKCWDKYLGL